MATDIVRKALEEAMREVAEQSVSTVSPIYEEDGSTMAQPLEQPSAQVAQPLNQPAQAAAQPQAEPSETPENPDAPIKADGDTESKADLFVPSPESLSEIDIFKFVSLLNNFRSSPSFSEGETRVEVDSFWESLQPKERYFLYLGMLGMTQITLKEAKATEVSHPHDYGLHIGSKPGDSASPDEEIKKGALPADRLDTPDDHFAPIVVGESFGQRKKFLQMNAKRLMESR